MANRIDLSNILINFLKKARYERHIEEGTLEENQFYAVTDGNEKTEYGDLFGNIENQADLYNALYASRLFKMEMCNDVRGYDVVHKLYDRREFDLSKFTVVGNPTITDDGIASGFSGSNYIKIPYEWAKNVTNFKITGKFKVENSVQGNNSILGYVTSGYTMGLSFNSTTINWFAIKTSSDTSEDVNLYQRYSITPNIDYSYELQLNNNLYTFRLFDDTGSAVVNISKSTNAPFSITSNYLRLGVSGNYYPSNFMAGSIDLKYFSITVDGEEVFNGIKDLTQYDTYTLPSSEVITIPYILSVDGVKIVDVAYKPLVDQLYTETGMGNYIIIDETNKTFRLPLPDIYSQIENKTSFTLRKWED